LSLHGARPGVWTGDFVSLLGTSGCGKSTLLRLIADILAPTDGTISVAGDVPASARRRRAFGFVFQDATLLAWRDAERNILLPLEIASDTHNARQRAQRLLELVGLAQFGGAYPWQL